ACFSAEVPVRPRLERPAAEQPGSARLDTPDVRLRDRAAGVPRTDHRPVSDVAHAADVARAAGEAVAGREAPRTRTPPPGPHGPAYSVTGHRPAPAARGGAGPPERSGSRLHF